MKQLHFDYYMQITYAGYVSKCNYTLKCIPADNIRQHLLSYTMEIRPQNQWMEGVDSFGNAMVYGGIEEEQREFSFHIKGDVGIDKREYETAGDEAGLYVYRYPYGLSAPGEELGKFYQSLRSELDAKASDYEKGVFLMHILYGNFIYEKEVTDVNTTAEEAWNLGKGVCQDYAHILIALCRLAGIPARYVSGMLIGEGYSHAWVEIYCDNHWFALDPTNNLIVEDSHIKIGVGRDASNCQINRGIVMGGGSQAQNICVRVEEKTEEGEAKEFIP